MNKRILLLVILFVFIFGLFSSQETSYRAFKTDINTPFTDLVRNLESLEKSITTILFFLGKVALILLISIIIQRILFLIWNRYSQLIVDNFKNASGNEELNSVLPGLSQLARERLLREMRGVHNKLREHVDKVAPKNYRPNDRLVLPRATPDKRLANLVDSLNEFTPDQIDPVVQLLNVIFPTYGTKVTSILQNRGNNNEKIGITFEITDIEGHLASKLYTVWESPLNLENNQEQKLEAEEGEEEEGEEESSDALPSLKERYRLLLKPATRWLAIELSRREMVAAVPHQFYFGKKRTRYQAQIHHFFGVLYYASAPTHGFFFYKLATEDFQAAIKLCPNWYQPHENLADIYSTKGRQISNIKDGKIKGYVSDGRNLQRKAILEYESALKKCTDKESIRRIRIRKAISQLLVGDLVQIQEAKDEIEYLEKNWDATLEMNGPFIYSMATWYAITFTQGYGGDSIKKIAQTYLVYALVRNTENNFWKWAGKDPDFQKIRGNFAELQFVLLKELNRFSQLSNLKGEEFAKAIEKILNESKWLE
ncbi:MAG: hypothetical protein QNJ49_00150 [Mastigocoleus sp. MO_167.B18]|uniref:hypothetical protein n=1 Tax=Mastigocoleus sp. MO_188.B34 TaxID=3036635 RepID=UPI0026361070|nr:hypothetical protein [Mastigocoleus sp. MO_188.B34]MDJ0694155.1 hypothetical protein [Mastigocoleus sp. MO_188.B34]MDJ0771829.1 hypothetical protein [Mastigocoleus sp. MO_167.B18]